MKKLFLVCLMAVVGFGVCSAQNAQAKKSVETVVFKTDIDCDHCVTKIMNNVPSLGKGIKDVQADLATKEITVVFDASKNDIATIVKGFESLKVKAEPKMTDLKAATCEGKTCCKDKAACADKASCDKKAICDKAATCEGKTCCKDKATCADKVTCDKKAACDKQATCDGKPCCKK